MVTTSGLPVGNAAHWRWGAMRWLHVHSLHDAITASYGRPWEAVFFCGDLTMLH